MRLRILLRSGSVVEAGEERIGGGVAKRYRYPHEERGQRLGPATAESRIAEVQALGRELQRRMGQRKASAPSHFSDLDGWVSPEVWKRVFELLMEASKLMHDNNQPPRSPGAVHVSATSWTFQMTRKERS